MNFPDNNEPLIILEADPDTPGPDRRQEQIDAFGIPNYYTDLDLPEEGHYREYLPEGIGPDPESTNIYALYEDCIGPINPRIGHFLQQADNGYPQTWIDAAFTLLLQQKTRDWWSLAALLHQWTEHGFPEDLYGLPRLAPDQRPLAPAQPEIADPEE